MAFLETQWDGLVGLTHNYAGLSHGNLASEINAGDIAYPRRAALQGLEKMRFVASLGIPQYILPPQPRPNCSLLRRFGYRGSMQQMLDAAWRADPRVLYAAWSASAMWTANAATVSPSPDTEDGRLHLTPANLASTLHRQQESEYTAPVLRRVFGRAAEVHEPLPACVPYTDEGAANHMRVCAAHGEPGVELFVHGGKAGRFPVRQTQAASRAVARAHGVRVPIFVTQRAAAIDAGAFHNDVIAMSNERLLIYHEQAFEEEEALLSALARQVPGFEAVRVTEADLPLEEAVSSYFFNAQLLSLPEGGMALLAPAECGEHKAARRMLERLPVASVRYLDVRESMKNGGGPACLRLRVAMSAEERDEIPEEFRCTEERYAALRTWIERHYPDTLRPGDLRDAALAESCLAAQEALRGMLNG
jgi:succinylarginine dihydrolase